MNLLNVKEIEPHMIDRVWEVAINEFAEMGGITLTEPEAVALNGLIREIPTDDKKIQSVRYNILQAKLHRDNRQLTLYGIFRAFNPAEKLETFNP